MDGKTTRTRPAKYRPGADGLLDIVATLRDQVNKANVGPSWREKAKAQLVKIEAEALLEADFAQDTPRGFRAADAMIRLGQIEKAAGVIDPDIANFMISHYAQAVAGGRHDTDPELTRIQAEIAAAKKKYGLEDDDDWTTDEVPEDVKPLCEADNRRWREIEVAVLREYGETEMAESLSADWAAFNARYHEPGRAKIYGPLPKELVGGLPGPDK